MFYSYPSSIVITRVYCSLFKVQNPTQAGKVSLLNARAGLELMIPVLSSQHVNDGVTIHPWKNGSYAMLICALTAVKWAHSYGIIVPVMHLQHSNTLYISNTTATLFQWCRRISLWCRLHMRASSKTVTWYYKNIPQQNSTLSASVLPRQRWNINKLYYFLSL